MNLGAVSSRLIVLPDCFINVSEYIQKTMLIFRRQYAGDNRSEMIHDSLTKLDVMHAGS